MPSQQPLARQAWFSVQGHDNHGQVQKEPSDGPKATTGRDYLGPAHIAALRPKSWSNRPAHHRN